MGVTIRKFERKDLVPAANVAGQAFGTDHDRTEDLDRYTSFQSDGWLVAEIDGDVVGMVGAVDYGPFAYVGMMVVLPDRQRMGIGKKLMSSLINWLDARNCPVNLLDATAAGEPLYKSFDFIALKRTHRFKLKKTGFNNLGKTPEGIEKINRSHIQVLASFDRLYFGADRQFVLERYESDFPDRGFILQESPGEISGYILTRPDQIGPWVCKSESAAHKLLEVALTMPYEERPYVLFPEENEKAAKLLEHYGFEYLRSCRHMVRGAFNTPIQRKFIYGKASLAIG